MIWYEQELRKLNGWTFYRVPENFYREQQGKVARIRKCLHCGGNITKGVEFVRWVERNGMMFGYEQMCRKQFTEGICHYDLGSTGDCGDDIPF